MKVSDPKQPADDESQQGEKPADDQAVRFMMADVFEALTGLAVVKALILDLPPASGHPKQSESADLGGRNAAISCAATWVRAPAAAR